MICVRNVNLAVERRAYLNFLWCKRASFCVPCELLEAGMGRSYGAHDYIGLFESFTLESTPLAALSEFKSKGGLEHVSV